MTKEEIHKLVDKHTLWYDSIGRQIIDENGTDDLKDELVKLFAISDVVCTCCGKTKANNQFLKRPSKYCLTCGKEL